MISSFEVDDNVHRGVVLCKRETSLNFHLRESRSSRETIYVTVVVPGDITFTIEEDEIFIEGSC